MGKLIEGFWDCKYCGTKSIRGRQRECPNCGKMRDKDTIFYLANNKKYVDTQEASKISRKPDWLCEYCDQLNSDSENICIACGAPRSEEN